jgi:hypothetical protein
VDIWSIIALIGQVTVVLIAVLIVALVIIGGASTLMISSRISRMEEIGHKKRDVEECDKDG